MLLGYEFQLLSMIAQEYQVHKDGFYRLNVADVLKRFPGDEKNLSKLQFHGLLTKNDDLILIDCSKWIELFIEKLNKSFLLNFPHYSCSYNDKKEIVFSRDSKEVKFKIKLNDDKKYDDNNSIYLCYCKTFDTYLFWLDLLNDINLLTMFISYIENELLHLKFLDIYKFDFFQDIQKGLQRQVFESIINYFKNKGYRENKKNKEALYIVHKLISSDEMVFFQFNFAELDLIIVEDKNSIKFFPFINGNLEYTENLIKELKTLEKILKWKVDLYWNLFMLNQNKVTSNLKNILSISTIFVTGINSLILYAISKQWTSVIGLTSSSYLIISAMILQLLVLIGTFWWIALPSIRISIFGWKIRYIEIVLANFLVGKNKESS
jgi:hypothetical protein